MTTEHIIITSILFGFCAAWIFSATRRCRKLRRELDLERENHMFDHADANDLKRLRGAVNPSSRRLLRIIDSGYCYKVAFCLEGYAWPAFIVKEYCYDPADPEDKAFQRREADELIDKITEG